ncbi:hypothetical protein GJ744_008464 [Endocarpon pusillum]|uniref:Uncharacterized protein n=1 Tax=Endocarpon pusillum TaxID=364733 RepID=A0A8H7AJ28_9EURO|nr:hypothetical protein GJ744_008464 [Endocarpon pusillum]
MDGESEFGVGRELEERCVEVGKWSREVRLYAWRTASAVLVGRRLLGQEIGVQSRLHLGGEVGPERAHVVQVMF